MALIRKELARLDVAIHGVDEDFWPEAIQDYDAQRNRLLRKQKALEAQLGG